MLIVPALVTGPFLPDLFLVIISIVFVYEKINQKDFSLFNFFFFKYFIAIYILLLISSIFSENLFFSLKSSLPYIRFPIFVLAMIDIINKNVHFFKHLTAVFVVTFFVLSIDSFIQLIFRQNIMGYKMVIESRVSSFFKDELILGSYISRFYPIFLSCMIYIYNKNKNKIFLFLILGMTILSIIMVFISGERASFFFIIFSFFLMIVLFNNFKILNFVIIIVFSSFIIFIINLNYSEFKLRLIDQTIYQKNSKTEIKKVFNEEDRIILKKYVIFTEQHSHHYLSAIKIFRDNIFIGAGPRMFRELCKNKKYMVSTISCSTHPHNSYVQLLAETGIVGFSMYLFIFAYLIINFIKHIYYKISKKDPIFSDYEICLLVAIFVSLFPFTTNGNIFNNWLNIIYFFPVGLFLASRQRIKF
jgi:hypothetical protein